MQTVEVRYVLKNLTNLDPKAFDLEKRLDVVLGFRKLGDRIHLLAEGVGYIEDLAETQALAALAGTSGNGRRMRKRQGETLKDKDPQ